MGKQIIIMEEAWQDIDAITDYYPLISSTLRVRFENELFETFSKLQHGTVSFRHYKYKYRRVNLDVFPYKVFYKELPDTIIIAAIIHASRGSSFLKQKLPE